MKSGKIFQRAILAAFIVIFLLSAVVGATVKLYTASGEGYCYETESQDIAKQRAVDKAVKKATKEAGIYLKTYSRSVNSELTDDEVTAITSNAWQLVGEPKFTREIINHSGDTQIIVWTANVEVNVDDSEIQSWIKRDDKDKLMIISQTREAQKASEENDKKIEDLRKQYNSATSQSEKDKILKQMNDADRDFLANQKNEEGLKLHYSKDYNGAIKLYNEAIEIDPNAAYTYNNRGIAYNDLGQNERAIQDYNKAIKLNPNLAELYNNRGLGYQALKQYERAIQDYNKAIQINPNLYQEYYNRGLVYQALKQYKRAIQDYNKAIQINPNFDMIYSNRGAAYIDGLKQYERAIQDCNKAIELNPKNYDAYNNRGSAYYYLKQYEQAFQNFNKAIELNTNDYQAYTNRGAVYFLKHQYDLALQDFNKAIKINPDYVLAYINLAIFYKKLGDEEKAKTYLKKATELGYNG